MNEVILYSLYITFYIPLEVVFLILLLNWIIYQFIVFLANTYYYLAETKLRREGKPFSRIITHNEDMFFWMETPSNLSYITMVNKMAKKLDLKQIKKLLIEKMLTGLNERGEALFPTVRQIRKEGYFFSSWHYPGYINIDDHVTEIEIDLSTEKAVEKFVSEQQSISLPKDKPRFHVYILNDSTINKAFMIFKFHHSICDGLSAWKLIITTCDVDNKEEIAAQKLAIVQLTPLQRSLLYVKTFIMIPIYLIDNTLYINKYRRRYVDKLTGIKRIAWTNKLDFEKIRELKKKTKTTVNDVVMTLLTEATRRYFIRHGLDDVISREIVYGMGVALEGNMTNKILTNNTGGLLLTLPTNIEGKFNQLMLINRNMNQLKRRMWPLFMSITAGFLMALPIGTSLKKYMIDANSIMIGVYSNAPGPNSALQWKGVAFDETYAVLMTSSEQAIACGFLTYNGRMHFTVKVDTALMEEPNELVRDVEKVLEEMHSEIQ